MPHRSWLLVGSLVLLSVCGVAVLADSSDVVPLPVTTIETTVSEGGKVVQHEQEDFVGVFALPYNSHPGTRHPAPPLGYREERKQETLKLQGTDWAVTRIEWTPADPKGIMNFDASKITIWTSDQLKAPEFRIPMKGGPDLCLPAGTLRFEHLPTVVDEGSERSSKLDTLATVNGEYVATEDFSLAERDLAAFRYSYEVRTRKASVKGELWLSEGVPGGVYRHHAEMAGDEAVSYTMQVKAVGLEKVREDLQKVEQGGLAVAVPEGWKQVPPAGGDEIFRLVRIALDAALNRTITIEMKPAEGKDYKQWGKAFMPDGTGYGVFYALESRLADSPTFDIYRVPASTTRVRTHATGTVRDGRLYLLSHWQDKVGRDAFAGLEDVEQVAASWRWLSGEPDEEPKTTP